MAPVLNEDVHKAHRQAVLSGFRQAIATAISKMEVTGGGSMRELILADPERYILGYRITQQARKDLFYRIEILIWVDYQLLEKEYGYSSGSHEIY